MMKEFPMEKYTFYTDDPENPTKVYAVSTYAGKYVRGVAKCDPRDKFSMEKGKKLAAARCSRKVADKRLTRAVSKYTEALEQQKSADKYVRDMREYMESANEELYQCYDMLVKLLGSM